MHRSRRDVVATGSQPARRQRLSIPKRSPGKLHMLESQDRKPEVPLTCRKWTSWSVRNLPLLSPWPLHGACQKSTRGCGASGERHGPKAPDVAEGWSRDLTECKDPEAAAVCLEIAEAASELPTERTTASGAREPALTEILSGAVTGAMVRADRVKRRDVEKLMKKTKRRRK
jgi:hypothetical protein